MNTPAGAEYRSDADWNHDMSETKIEKVVLLSDGIDITVNSDTQTLHFDRLKSYDHFKHFYGDWTVNRMDHTDEEITLHCIGEKWQGFKIVVGWEEIDKLFY